MRSQYIRLCFVEIGKMKRRIAWTQVQNEGEVNATMQIEIYCDVAFRSVLRNHYVSDAPDLTLRRHLKIFPAALVSRHQIR